MGGTLRVKGQYAKNYSINLLGNKLLVCLRRERDTGRWRLAQLVLTYYIFMYQTQYINKIDVYLCLILTYILERNLLL